MKGLEEYRKKHGSHFTVSLAYDVVKKLWDAEDIYNTLQKKVYYNVSGFTLGDIVFVFNGCHGGSGNKHLRRNHVLRILGDVNTGNVFNTWKNSWINSDFDFTPYI